ncbi:MAG: YfhO family protein [Isosphaeraceae bacterium]
MHAKSLLSNAKLEAGKWMIGASVLALVAWLLAPGLWGRVLVMHDLGNYSLPGRWFLATCLRNGDAYLWDPRLWCGNFVFGENPGTAHPLIMLLYRVLPFATAASFEFAACYLLMFVAMYLFTRRVAGVDAVSGSMAAFLYAFTGFNIQHYVHASFWFAGVHLPLLLLAVDSLLKSPDRKCASLAGLSLAVLTTSEILTVHPQMLWVLGLCELTYAGAACLQHAPARRRLLALASSKMLGILGGCVQLLPSLEVFSQSHRTQVSREFLATGSLPPISWAVQSLSPYLFKASVVAAPTTIPVPPVGTLTFGPAVDLTDWRACELGIYAGAIVPALVAWLVIRWTELNARQRVVARLSLCLALVGLMLSFGEFTPLFELTSRLPPFSLFRDPARYRIAYSFATALLVAVSFQDLRRASLERLTISFRRCWPIFAVVAASMGVTMAGKLYGRIHPEAPLAWAISQSKTEIVLGCSLVATAGALVVLAARRGHWITNIIVVLCIIDVMYFDYRYTKPSSSPRLSEIASTYDPALPREVLRPRANDGQDHRVGMGKGTVWSNAPTIGGVKFVEGYTPVIPLRSLDYDTTSALRLAGADWRIEVGVEGESSWKPVPDPLPRVRLVTKTRLTDDARRDVELIDVEACALVERDLNLTSGASGKAAIVVDRPGQIEVEADAPTAQLLVLSERFAHGWKAFVDGQAAEVLRVNGDFQGCVIPAGRHTAQFVFAPRSFTIGLVLSLMSLLTMLIWFGLTLANRRWTGRPLDEHRGHA